MFATVLGCNSNFCPFCFFSLFLWLFLKSFEWSHSVCMWLGLSFFFSYSLSLSLDVSTSASACSMEVDELIPQKHFEWQKSFPNIFTQTHPPQIHLRSHTSYSNRKTFYGMYSKYLRLLFLVKCFDIILDTKPWLEDMQLVLTSFHIHKLTLVRWV